MPCGGITQIQAVKCPCFYCGGDEVLCDHEVIEWDSVIHGKCIANFMMTEEGKIIYEHGHHIYGCIDGQTFIIRTHRRKCSVCEKMFRPSLEKVIEYVNRKQDYNPDTCKECL